LKSNLNQARDGGQGIPTDFKDSKHKDLTAAIISIFYKVYNTLGYGSWKKFMKMP
jgi:hypothetical protein